MRRWHRKILKIKNFHLNLATNLSLKNLLLLLNEKKSHKREDFAHSMWPACVSMRFTLHCRKFQNLSKKRSFLICNKPSVECNSIDYIEERLFMVRWYAAGDVRLWNIGEKTKNCCNLNVPFISFIGTVREGETRRESAINCYK